MDKHSLQYIKLRPDDGDIPFLLKAHRTPEIKQYISIDESRYFHYVTGTDGVSYYKVLCGSTLVAALHLECTGNTLFLSLFVLPEHQKKGIAAQMLDDLKTTKLGLDFSKIQVSVDETNTASLCLFEKAGFVCIGKDAELIDLIYQI